MRTCSAPAGSHSPAMPGRMTFAALGLIATVLSLDARGAEAPLADYTRVDVAATKTSIYVGSVKLTMPTFVRTNGIYEATFDAKVFPLFFYNQTGRLKID